MMTGAKLGAAAVMACVLVAGQAMAQAGQSRNQVRLKILDTCVLTQSGKSEAEGAGPKCGCYATKITKAMTDEEIAKWKKGVPKRLTEESNKIFAGCK
jgi:hypothetical protein